MHGVAGNPVQVHPAGGVTETNVALEGGADSANVPLVIALDPVFVTTDVNVMLLFACTGFGVATLVTERFCPLVPTVVLTLAVLLEEVGSMVDEPTVAVWVITVPLAVVPFTFTTMVIVPEANA